MGFKSVGHFQSLGAEEFIGTDAATQDASNDGQEQT